MNSNKQYFIVFSTIYAIFSSLIITLILIEDHTNSTLEIIFKISALMSLAFLYLNRVQNVNFYYIGVILISIIDDSLMTFENLYLDLIMVLLVLEKVLYTLIIKDIFKKYSLAKIVLYTMPHFITGSIIFFFFSNIIGVFDIQLFLAYIFIVGIGGLTFVNVIDKNTLKSRLLFFGVFLMSIGDILIALSLFIGRNVSYLIAYYIMYFVGRYLICNAMFFKK